MIRSVSPALGLALFVLTSLAPRPGSAQGATLVRDIRSSAPSGFPNAFFSDLDSAGGKLFLVGGVSGTGREIWVSDGTSAGTGPLRDGCPGECSSDPRFLLALGRIMLWTEPDGGGADRLWRSDGSRTGTFPLTGEPLDLGKAASAPAFYTAPAGGGLFFLSCQELPGNDEDCDLWRTGGTVESTRIVEAGPKYFPWLAAAGNRLYYLAFSAEAWELWTLSPGGAAPQRLRRFSSARNQPPGPPTVAGGKLFFLAAEAEGEELWTSDGTVVGTKALTRFAPAQPIAYPLRAAGSRVYFVAGDGGAAGKELWGSDGTAAGTRRLTNLPHPNALDETFPIAAGAAGAAGERLVFTVRNLDDSTSLWSSRGTAATTVPLPLPSCAGCDLNLARPFLEAQGKLYFFVQESFSSVLWATDGTAAGTRSLFPGCDRNVCNIGAPSPWRNGVLVGVDQGVDRRVWFSDGTAGGTRTWSRFGDEIPVQDALEVKDLGDRSFFTVSGPFRASLWVREPDGQSHPAAQFEWRRDSSDPAAFLALGDRIVFAAKTDRNPFFRGLWGSLGTPETTVELTPQDAEVMEDPGVVRAGGLAYFQAEELGAINLWRTDGTPAGTFVVAHLQGEAPMTAANGGLVFFDAGWIWRTDGTVAGTVKTGDLPAGLFAESLWTGPDGIYFAATTPVEGKELWITDGTNAGTRSLTQFAGPSSLWSDPELAVLGGFVYFVAPTGLWRTDGTEAGTVSVVPLPEVEVPVGLSVFQGSLYYFRHIRFQGEDFRLWRTDGSAAGTVEIARFPEQPHFTTADGRVTPFGGRAYFAIDDGVHGRELWSTDGTPAGTTLVHDLLPGPRGSGPAGLVVASGSLYFSAGDTAHGVELWKSDGTAAGTRLVQDIAPQALSASPDQLTVAGSQLYFSADDGLTGHEPWVLPLAGGTACQAGSTRLCLGGGRYAVEALWRDHQGNEGVGHPVALTADTGYFWFFDPANVETVLKVLDGRGVNGHVWTFYGALSDVEYALTVTDTETGLSHRYLNPEGQLASVADVRSFGPEGASPASGPVVTTAAAQGAALTLPALIDRRVVARAATGACAPSSNRLCLNGSRYSVEMAWKDFTGNTGTGQAVGLTGDTGYFWFFNSANVELVLKVLDGTAVNGHRWVFYGALSSVEYTVTVTDTETGEIKTYRNPSGNLASVADTVAF